MHTSAPFPKHFCLIGIALTACWNGFCLPPSSKNSTSTNCYSNSQYRTVASGNYSNPSIWECTADGMVWMTNGLIPTANDSTITISSNNIVTLDVPLIQLDELVIASGAKLILQNGIDPILKNGPGVDLMVFGTFQSDARTGHEMTCESGARWKLDALGTIIKTSDGTSAVYRDNYDGGIGTIPATSNWIIRKTDPNIAYAPGLLSAAPMVYPNLIIENMSGVFWNMTVGSRFNTTTQSLRIKGKLDIGGNGTQGINAYHEMSNINYALIIDDSLIIRDGCSFTNNSSSPGQRISAKGNIKIDGTLDFNMSGAGRLELAKGSSGQMIDGNGIINVNELRVDAGTTATNQMNNANPITITQTLTISSTASLSNVSNSANGFGFQLKGDVVVNGSLLYKTPANNNGRFSISGLSMQNITGIGSILLANLRLNNASGLAIGSSTKIVIDNLLEFQNGLIHTTSISGITLNPRVAITGTSINNFINGPFQKVIDNSVVGEELVLPTGKQNVTNAFRPVIMYPLTITGADTFSVEYFSASPPSASWLGTFVSGHLNTEYWVINKLSSGNATARIKINYIKPAASTDWLPFAPLTNTKVAIIQGYGNFPSSFNWYLAGELGGANYIKLSSPFMMGTDYTNSPADLWTQPLTTFGAFGIGFGIPIVLPVTITNFTLQRINGAAQLNWKMHDIDELKQLQVEHSLDGQHFQSLGNLSANQDNFQFTHDKPQHGNNYYRIKWLTKENKTYTSIIKTLLINRSVVKAYLSTENNMINMAFTCQKAGYAYYTVLDITGKQYLHGQYHIDTQMKNVTVSIPYMNKQCVYILVVLLPDGKKETILLRNQ